MEMRKWEMSHPGQMKVDWGSEGAMARRWGHQSRHARMRQDWRRRKGKAWSGRDGRSDYKGEKCVGCTARAKLAMALYSTPRDAPPVTAMAVHDIQYHEKQQDTGISGAYQCQRGRTVKRLWGWFVPQSPQRRTHRISCFLLPLLEFFFFKCVYIQGHVIRKAPTIRVCGHERGR
jgi:hypothetical protein